MTIKMSDMLFGAAIKRLITSLNVPISIENYQISTNNTVIINKKIALFMKSTTKAVSPWRFSFTKENQVDLQTLNDISEYTFLILICAKDGIVCLSYRELKIILDEQFDNMEWIAASRRKKESYQLSGSNGKLDFKVSDSDFISKLSNLIIL